MNRKQLKKRERERNESQKEWCLKSGYRGSDLNSIVSCNMAIRNYIDHLEDQTVSLQSLIDIQDEYIKHIESPIPKTSTSFTAYYLKREKLREKINKLKGGNK